MYTSSSMIVKHEKNITNEKKLHSFNKILFNLINLHFLLGKVDIKK